MYATETSPDWLRLHHDSKVVDLHAHPALKAVLFRRNLARSLLHPRPFFWPVAMRTDFANLRRGGVDALLSATYIPEASLLRDIPALKLLRLLRPGVWRDVIRPPYFQATLFALTEMEAQIERANRCLQPGQRPACIVHSPAELDAALDQGSAGPIALVHCIEGSHSLHGELAGKTVDPAQPAPDAAVAAEILANLETLHRRGVAYITLAHFYPNHIVSPVFPFPEGLLNLTRQRQVLERHDPNHGLSALGEQVARRMFDLGMLVDISHCTPAARSRIYAIAAEMGVRSRIMATHVGAYSLNPSLYNLEDWEIRWLAAHDGLVGVIFMNYWLMPKETMLGLDAVARTLLHLIDIAGSDHIAAFGSDWDGFTDPPNDLVDASWLPQLTKRLAAHRQSGGARTFSDTAIRNILGENALRLLRAGWKASS